jgi:ATP-dependent RNA helicase DeaD
VAQEQQCSPEDLALAALELSLGGKPLLLHKTFRHQVEERGGSGIQQRRPADGERPDSPPESHMERFRVEVGWRDRVKPGNIVGAIANEARLDGRSIGRIRIFDSHSTVDLPRGMPDDVFTDLQRLRVMNKELQISRLSV